MRVSGLKRSARPAFFYQRAAGQPAQPVPLCNPYLQFLFADFYECSHFSLLCGYVFYFSEVLWPSWGFFFRFTKMGSFSKKLQIWASRANLARLYMQKSCQVGMTLSRQPEVMPSWHDFCHVNPWSRVNLARLCPNHIYIYIYILFFFCKIFLFGYWLVSYVMFKINLIHNFLRVLIKNMKNKKKNVHIAELKVTIKVIVRTTKLDNKIQFQVWLLIFSFSLPKYLYLHKKFIYQINFKYYITYNFNYN